MTKSYIITIENEGIEYWVNNIGYSSCGRFKKFLNILKRRINQELYDVSINIRILTVGIIQKPHMTVLFSLGKQAKAN